MAMSYQWPVNNTFNPLNQTFIVLAPDGRTQVQVNLAETQNAQANVITAGICQGVQMGAAGILFLTLFLITKPEKRRSLVFILNALALVLLFMRGIFTAICFSGPLYSWYRWQLVYYAGTATARAISVCAQICDLLLVSVLEASLVLQVRIVCCTLDPHWRYLVNAFNIFVALLEVGLLFAVTCLTITWNILGVNGETEEQYERIGSIAKPTNILLVTSIATTAAVFCAKLGFAIRARRSMGMTQFGPMQIIFVMGCQTMCLPLIFVLIALYAAPGTWLQSFAPGVVACCLPLSAMWAAANTTHFHLADPHRGHAIQPSDPESGKACTTTTATTMSDTLMDEEISPTPVSQTSSAACVRKSKTDVEMRQMCEGVYVDRTYSVRSD